ncbi:MAG: hypothetical protein IJB17_01490 [Oscillospiraceae bacterium]|nr:hypothetical protein [Oscillospiraceae bacterium]
MDIRDRAGLYREAESRLAAAPNLKRLILLHTVASAAVLLAVTALNYVLQDRIGDTGGLGGMGMRSALSTASTVLQLAVNLAMPFWVIGYSAVVLRTLRGEPCEDRTLLSGFRQFGPVLRLTLLQNMLLILLAMLCIYPAALIFMMTPWAKPMMQAMVPFSQTAAPTEEQTQALTQALEGAYLPIMGVYTVLVLLVALPLLFRLRFSALALMDAPQSGALAAMRKSIRLTKGNCGAVLRVDLHFWWYFLLELAVTVLAYGDVLLTLFGVTVPVDRTVLFFGIYAVYLAAQIGLYCWQKNRVELTYGCCYRALESASGQSMPVQPRKVPWNDYYG